MIYRLSSKTLSGVTVALLSVVATFSMPCFAQATGKNIEEIIARGDTAYVNNDIVEAVSLYQKAHDLLPNNASTDLKKLVNERYQKSLSLNQGTVYAPSASVTTTENKAIARLDNNMQESMVLVEKARESYSKKKYEDALQQYREALDILPVAEVTKKRRDFILDSIGDASVAVAMEYSKVGRYDEARTMLEDTLKRNPDYKMAANLLASLDDPVRNNPAKTPAHVQSVREVERLLNLGYGYYDLGKFDDAAKSFEAVLRIDKTNTSARRGMESVTRRKEQYGQVAYSQMRGEALTQVTKTWETPINDDTLPDVIGESSPSAVGGSALDEKLRTMVVPRVDFEGVDLMEAVSFLRKQSEVLGDGTGINFTLNIGDPTSDAAKKILSKKFDLKLTNIPLRDLVQYITQATGTLSFITSYSVEISSHSDNMPMISKAIPLPPGFFTGMSAGDASADGALDPFSTDASNNSIQIKRVDPKTALMNMGVSFPEGAYVQYNAQKASMLIFNTPQNVHLIEELVAVKSMDQLNQVVVSVTVIEVSEETLKELGFEWIVNSTLSPGKIFGSGGDPTDAVSNLMPTVAGVAPIPSAGLVTGGLRSGKDVVTNSVDSLIKYGSSGMNIKGYVPGNAPGFFTMRGVWGSADISMIIRGLDQKKGVDMIQHPEVIVRKGEKATIFSGKEFPYPEDYEAPQLPNSVGSNNSSNGGSNMIVTPAHPTGFLTRNIGMTCEVEVTEVQEGKIVHLTVSPEFVEFDGFINYGSPITVPIIGYENNKMSIESLDVTKNEILQPVFSTKKTSTTLSVETGHTVMFGGLRKAKTVKFEDKVPILGDLPLVGRLFRSEGSQEERTALVMMVKAELIDAAGRHPNTGAPIIGAENLISDTSSPTAPAENAASDVEATWGDGDEQPASADTDNDPFAE